MNQLSETRAAIDSVLRIMAERDYATSTIKTHRGILNSLIKFMEKNHFWSCTAIFLGSLIWSLWAVQEPA